MSENVIREYERIIDSGFRPLSIFQLPLPSAAYGVLTAFDSHLLTEQILKQKITEDHFSYGQSQMFKILGEGFNLAMRWLLEKSTSIDVFPTPDESLATTGNDLIDYGSKYFTISAFYSMYSQGRISAAVELGEPAIRFFHENDSNDKRPSWGFADEASNEILRKTGTWRTQLQQLQKPAYATFRHIPYRLKRGRIVFPNPSLLRSQPVQQYVCFITDNQRIFPDDTDMDGFTIRDFTAFWDAIYAWSICATEIYFECYRNGIPQEQCMPTQVVPRNDFVIQTSTIAQIPQRTTEKILDRLTADHRTNKFDIFLQPFICGKNMVSWSVRGIQYSQFQRNLLKLMARTPHQKGLADGIIGDREGPLINALSSLLSGKGWAVDVTRKITGEEDCEVDLIAWNPAHADEILIVEAKACLQADDPNEVQASTREMMRAQEQVRRINRVLQRMSPEIRLSRFPKFDWSSISKWYGIVITPEGEAGFNFDHSTIPACSLATLQHRLSPKDWVSPRSIRNAARDRRWQAPIHAGRIRYEPIKLAGVTFELPMIHY